MDCWEPMVFVARDKGTNAVYADPKEGYLLWAMAAYIVQRDMPEEELQATYDLLNFMLGGWYGAKITLMRGYMTNPLAADYAESHPDAFTPEEAARVREITKGVEAKFAKGGTWQSRWPTHVDAYEEEWTRSCPLVIVGAQDSGTGYAVLFGTEGSTTGSCVVPPQILRIASGGAEPITQLKKTPIRANERFTLRVSVSKSELRATYNGKFLVNINKVHEGREFDNVTRYEEKVYAFDSVGEACAFVVSQFNE